MQENPEKTTSGGPALIANPPEGYTFYYIYRYVWCTGTYTVASS